ncbi:hypothetical protein [Nocardioides daphniae]|uniref:Uncharacterized protein n=1 Tax=Nocardioides daphniae TaxID=402297 RepID=A0A4P7UC32_9ACTN|nr:hypothetical protein [Nocardioides daphniae]QCC77566.1 hypothetical protein E2C04_10985 [Nocardioides daphniae]GGD30688.1 hypothetical protein GCM10007231_32720 [Nocardioides daphniae]
MAAWGQSQRRAGARRADQAERVVVSDAPVARGPVLDDRLRPVSVKRSKKIGKDVRVDATRVSGPIRVVLEPMLWLAFLSGITWVLIALDPGVRNQADDIVFYEFTLPLAIIVAAILLISTISALMWLPVSTSSTRARTAFAGLGMLASGWLFAKLHPVDTQDLLGMSWISIGVGVLLVAICAVPWPTSPSVLTRRPTGVERTVLVVLLGIAGIVAYYAWDASQVGLVGVSPGGQTGWDRLLPLLGLFVIVMAAVRFMLLRPERRADVELPDAGLPHYME